MSKNFNIFEKNLQKFTIKRLPVKQRQSLLYNNFMAVYFFYGDEDYLIDSQIEAMRLKLNPDFLSMSFKTFDNPEYGDLISVLRKILNLLSF